MHVSDTVHDAFTLNNSIRSRSRNSYSSTILTCLSFTMTHWHSPLPFPKQKSNIYLIKRILIFIIWTASVTESFPLASSPGGVSGVIKGEVFGLLRLSMKCLEWWLAKNGSVIQKYPHCLMYFHRFINIVWEEKGKKLHSSVHTNKIWHFFH